MDQLDLPDAKRVLVAEDERHVANLIERSLARQGYEITMVCDGRAAVEALQTASYSHAILDLMMPFMDGMEVIAWIRTHEETKGVWIALMSAQAEGMSREDWPHKPDLWVQKPLASEDPFDLP